MIISNFLLDVAILKYKKKPKFYFNLKANLKKKVINKTKIK